MNDVLRVFQLDPSISSFFKKKNSVDRDQLASHCFLCSLRNHCDRWNTASGKCFKIVIDELDLYIVNYYRNLTLFSCFKLVNNKL